MNPMQDIVFDEHDTARFKRNKIVEYLLDKGGIDLNHLAALDLFDTDDWNQFAQLIGYSVSGFGTLSYADPNIVAEADAQVEEMIKERAKKSKKKKN